MNPKFYTFAMMINLFKKTNCYFYWFEKMAGFPLNERSGFIQFWLLFLGVNLTFFPMHFLGLAGMPRRILDYPDHFFGLNMLVLGGSLLTAAGLSIFFQNILISYLNSIVTNRKQCKDCFRQEPRFLIAKLSKFKLHKKKFQVFSEPVLSAYLSLYELDKKFLIPELITVGSICCIILFFSLFKYQKGKLYPRSQKILNHITFLGLLGIYYHLYAFDITNNILIISQTMILSSFTIYFKKLIVIFTALIIAVSGNYVGENKHNFCEYYVLFFCLLLGSFILLSANNLLTLYIGLEMQALASYILAAFDGKSLGNEAGLKYFLVGSFSSAFVLFGMSLILYTTGSTDMLVINISIGNLISNPLSEVNLILLIIGIYIITIRFLIKLGIGLFHLWVANF